MRQLCKWIRMVLTGGPSIMWGARHCRRYLRHPEKYTVKEKHAYANALGKRLAKRAFKTEFIITGEENLKKAPGQALFVSNHVSVLDPIFFMAYSDRPVTFLGKKQILKMPFVSTVLRSIDGAFIDREDLRSEIKVFREINNLLKDQPDLSFCVYPEGTRSKGPEFPMADFKGGTFKIATRLDLPIIPVAAWLTERSMDPHYHYHKYPLQVAYCEPIMPEEYEKMTTGQIAAIAQERVEAKLKELKANDLKLIMKYNNYKEEKAKKVQYSSSTHTI